MKPSPSDHHDRDPLNEERDPLWQLLGKSPRPEPDAWFTVRTVARCRNAGLGQEPWWAFSLGRFSLGRMRWALGGGLSLCLAVVLMLGQVPQETAATAKTYDVQDAFAAVASIDTPDADSSSSSPSWQDSSSL